nr:MAG TPA: hypothetical protein [Caudoviricetes sp.]
MLIRLFYNYQISKVGASGCIFSRYPFPSVNSHLWICSHSTIFFLK